MIPIYLYFTCLLSTVFGFKIGVYPIASQLLHGFTMVKSPAPKSFYENTNAYFFSGPLVYWFWRREKVAKSVVKLKEVSSPKGKILPKHA